MTPHNDAEAYSRNVAAYVARHQEVQTVDINVEELKELAAALAEGTPENTAEMAEICAELHRALDMQDSVKAAETKATAELKAQLEAATAPFKAQRQAIGAIMEAAKGALVRRLEVDEAYALNQIQHGLFVPAPRELPKGLRVSRATVLESVDVSKLPDEYLTLIADADKILQAAEAGHEIAGAVTKTAMSVVYTRPAKTKA